MIAREKWVHFSAVDREVCLEDEHDLLGRQEANSWTRLTSVENVFDYLIHTYCWLIGLGSCFASWIAILNLTLSFPNFFFDVDAKKLFRSGLVF